MLSNAAPRAMLSCSVPPTVIPWTVAAGLHCPRNCPGKNTGSEDAISSPEDLLDHRIKLVSPLSPACEWILSTNCRGPPMTITEYDRNRSPVSGYIDRYQLFPSSSSAINTLVTISLHTKLSHQGGSAAQDSLGSGNSWLKSGWQHLWWSKLYLNLKLICIKQQQICTFQPYWRIKMVLFWAHLRQAVNNS